MTSLQRQLATLRTAAASTLGVEKKHVSLLFDKRQAEELDRETVLGIGWVLCSFVLFTGRTGLTKLCDLEPSFAEDIKGPFFAEESLSFQRTLTTKYS